jgi:four helix bundle protein
MRSHHNLDAWQKSVDFVVMIYQITEKFPKEERFRLTSQIRRAAVSIPANIAEGAARKSDKEFLHFLSISQGSTSEVETEILIANRLGFLNESEFELLNKSLNDIGRMITGLSNHLRRKIA